MHSSISYPRCWRACAWARAKQPERNLGASVTNCESSMYTAAMLRGDDDASRLSTQQRAAAPCAARAAPPTPQLQLVRKRAQHC